MSNESLEGKKVLITGAGKRLGRGIAQSLAARGADLVLHYNRSASEVKSLQEELSGFRIKCCSLQGDLASEEQTEELFFKAAKLLDGIDILINNASIFPENRLLEFTSQDLWHNIQVNSHAPYLLSAAFYRQGREGVIINMLDTRILDYDSRHVPYHLSKRMLFSLTKMMALEFAPRVRVNGVAPGVILPPEGEDESYFEKIKGSNPLNTHGNIKDITDAVEFLIGSRFITGQVIYVDGGRHLKGAMYAQ